MTEPGRPQADEYNTYYHKYVERVPDGDIRMIMRVQLADTLARDHGVPFKTSHAIAGRFVAACTARPTEPRSVVLREVSASLLASPVALDEAALDNILSARNFVEVRTTHGGPAPSVTRPAIEASQGILARDQQWVSDRFARLRGAEEALAAAERAL